MTFHNVSKPLNKAELAGTMIVALREVVNKLRHCERSKAVVLCGEGSAFCSGLDLGLATKLTSLEVRMSVIFRLNIGFEDHVHFN